MPDNAPDLNDPASKSDPIHIRKFDGRIHVTATFLKARLRLPTPLFDQALTELGGFDGPVPFVAEDSTEQWIDKNLFYGLATSEELNPLISETGMSSVLFLLGEWSEREAA